jgi:hypothetical protein
VPDQEPRVGDRRASTQYGITAFADETPEPPVDALWTVEEWDGTHWRPVGSAKGDQERDRMLLPKAR